MFNQLAMVPIDHDIWWLKSCPRIHAYTFRNFCVQPRVVTLSEGVQIQVIVRESDGTRTGLFYIQTETEELAEALDAARAAASEAESQCASEHGVVRQLGDQLDLCKAELAKCCDQCTNYQATVDRLRRELRAAHTDGAGKL